jgi:hypothetical protein
MNKLIDFSKGIFAVIIFGIIFTFYFFNKRDKELLEYVEKKLKLKPCGKITAIVILMSFLKFPMFSEQPPNLNENGTRLYSNIEVDCPAELDLLINEISEAALEAWALPISRA